MFTGVVQPISGAIRDLAWSEDSKRIVAVGEGRERFEAVLPVTSPAVFVLIVLGAWHRFGSVFMWDSGSSVGEITGQSKTILSCDFKVRSLTAAVYLSRY